MSESRLSSGEIPRALIRNGLEVAVRFGMVASLAVLAACGAPDSDSDAADPTSVTAETVPVQPCGMEPSPLEPIGGDYDTAYETAYMGSIDYEKAAGFLERIEDPAVHEIASDSLDAQQAWVAAQNALNYNFEGAYEVNGRIQDTEIFADTLLAVDLVEAEAAIYDALTSETESAVPYELIGDIEDPEIRELATTGVRNARDGVRDPAIVLLHDVTTLRDQAVAELGSNAHLVVADLYRHTTAYDQHCALQNR